MTSAILVQRSYQLSYQASLLGVFLRISDGHPLHFHRGVPPPPLPGPLGVQYVILKEFKVHVVLKFSHHSYPFIIYLPIYTRDVSSVWDLFKLRQTKLLRLCINMAWLTGGEKVTGGALQPHSRFYLAI